MRVPRLPVGQAHTPEGVRRARLLAASLLVAASLGAVPLVATAADEPLTPLTPHQEQGRKLYRGTCIHCHGPNVWGTLALASRLGAEKALLENRTDLAAPFVRQVVRAGLGSMPPMRRTELSDADIDAIADYLTRTKPTR